MTKEIELIRVVVRSLLEYPQDFEWTSMGFGMLRTYLDSAHRWRLNIWHRLLAVPGVSTIHDHPWDFTSWILSGEFYNQRYSADTAGLPYSWETIKTGENGGMDGSSGGRIWLRKLPLEVYWPGDSYFQTSREIHSSAYQDGSVTVNDRQRVGDGEHARVFWPVGTKWVDAKPREAMPWEIHQTVKAALCRWPRDYS